VCRGREPDQLARLDAASREVEQLEPRRLAGGQRERHHQLSDGGIGAQALERQGQVVGHHDPGLAEEHLARALAHAEAVAVAHAGLDVAILEHELARAVRVARAE
jgi:hypothetical protein